MAVVREAHLSCVDSSGSTTNTQALDCSGGTTLLVFCDNSVNSANDTTGATYNSVAMTELARTSRSSDSREIVMYGLHSPASGSNNIVVTRSTGTGRFVISAIAYSGTDTGVALPTAESDYCKTNTSDASTTVTITLGNDGDDAVYAGVVMAAGTVSGGTGATKLSTADIVSDFESSTFPATSNYAITASTTSGGNNAFIAVALQEAADDVSNAVFFGNNF